ncbi:type II toxin-antitoxin system RelE/ParE family toxin [Pseudomonas viridiflava]|uniref:type II toxin-antitoxin system RelE/ParE family toxin n=2 Tax=Pseudomonas viridiflava TaxID=33069 RepID=UPI000F010E1A|nr:type II toxin-antitoxin system RelE/ParE family toxin [Pseudomonas viridiflava]MEE4228762.1 type II toxin-antitoxin system RelE/ParE family toxin [Pseudomonas viridiflava]
MTTVEWSSWARQDLLAIIDYISDDNVTAAQEMKDTVESRVANLPLHPRLYKEGREPGTREMVVHPNYIVIYSESTTTLIVLRVLHVARKWPSETE